VDDVAFHGQSLNRQTIAVWHQTDGEGHHWTLDEQSSENLRRHPKEIKIVSNSETPHHRIVVNCPNCQTKQEVLVAVGGQAARFDPSQTVACRNCAKVLDAKVIGRIVGGPFPV
jgi:hypothetical protein